MRVQGTHTLVARLTASAAAHMCLCKAHTHPWLKAESLCKTQAQHMSLWKAQSKRKVAEGTTNGHVPVQGKSPHTCACARRTQTHTLGSRLTNSARHKRPHMCLCKAHTHTPSAHGRKLVQDTSPTIADMFTVTRFQFGPRLQTCSVATIANMFQLGARLRM